MESSKTRQNVRDRQARAIPFLLSSSTITAAAKQANISTAQIYEWLKDPEFKGELERQRSQMLEDAINRLKFGMTKAADTLVALLDSDNEMVKRGASNDILGHVARFKEIQDLEERILVLEQSNRG